MLNLPESFIKKYQKLLGPKEAQRLFLSLSKDSHKAFRINQLKNSQQVTYNTNKPIPDVDNSYYGSISGQDPEWRSGRVYSQDPSAMYPAQIIDIEDGDNVLDLCAAPGGKTTKLAEKLNSTGLLVANEISSSRAKILRENIERWGASNVLITNNDSFTLSKKFPHFFDKILVDAPCSGEGMFRKNPEAIEYWSPEYVFTCQNRQKEILTETIKMLKPGGELVYSTCTFSPEENEEIVSWLVNSFQMKIMPINNLTSNQISHGKSEWGSCQGLENTLRFWPQDGIGEGQFVAKLIKTEEDSEMINISNTNKEKKKSKRRIKAKDTLQLKEIELIEKVLSQFNLPNGLKEWQSNAKISNNHVFIPAITDSAGLKIINNGVELGLLKKNRFEPGHQLAEVLDQNEQTRVIDLQTHEDYLTYLHGETLHVKTDLRGFVLVSFKDMIFSFGKVTGNGVIKNFYPKGLRI